MRRHLVLWDIDYTLIDAGGLSRQLYGAVFTRLFGRELADVAPMAGRTDRAIILDTLARAAVDEPGRHVEAFLRGLAAAAPELGEGVRVRGRVLPGAAEALAAMAALADGAGRSGAGGQASAGRVTAAGDGQTRAHRLIVQSVLTGNIRPLAEAKLSALGLTRYLDLDVGAYGDAHEERTELVRLARRAAARAYGAGFSGEATVLVGDTPLDVLAALATGARVVAVASGGYTVEELAEARPHAVLPDLTDTPRVLAAILSPA